MLKNIKKIYQIKFHTLFIIILIYLPKINIITIPGLWQGIRIDDFFILLYLLYIVKNYSKNNIVVWGNSFKYKYWIIILYLFCFSILIGLINDVQSNAILILRALEYVVVIIFIYNHSESFQTYINIFKSYIIINFITVIFQSMGLIGSISSLGYLPPTDFLNQRAYGISGGSWEIGVLINISFMILIIGLKNNYEKFFYYLISGYILIEANGRANLIAFIVITIYLIFYKKNIFNFKNIKIFTFILIVILVLIIYEIGLNESYSLSYKIFIKDINFIFIKTIDLIVYNKVPTFSEVSSDNVYSYVYRLIHWNDIISKFKINDYHLIIGAGSPAIYAESTYIRIITSLGLLGVLITLFSIRKVQLIVLVIFLIMGFSLDLFLSMKIFIFTLVLSKIIYINNSLIHGNNIRKIN